MRMVFLGDHSGQSPAQQDIRAELFDDNRRRTALKLLSTLHPLRSGLRDLNEISELSALR
jgi:hypothetical protein